MILTKRSTFSWKTETKDSLAKTDIGQACLELELSKYNLCPLKSLKRKSNLAATKTTVIRFFDTKKHVLEFSWTRKRVVE